MMVFCDYYVLNASYLVLHNGWGMTFDFHTAYQGLIDNTQYSSSFFYLISIFVELAIYIQAE